MKNIAIGFLIGTAFWIVTLGAIIYPKYQQYKEYERKAALVQAGAVKVKDIALDKYKIWKNKND